MTIGIAGPEEMAETACKISKTGCPDSENKIR
jgi:hypothetical protein